MSTNQLVAYIGRFSLFHNGHAEVLLRALKKYPRVLVIIGSAKQPRTIKNPWSADERAQVIRRWYDEQDKTALGELIITTHRDYRYSNTKWLAETQKILTVVNNSNDPIVITGSKRDDTTFYLDMFPAPMYEMDLVEENRQVSKSLSATWCRELYLGRTLNDKTLSFNEYDALMRAFVPPSTMDYLREFEKTDHYAYLAEAYRIIKERQEELKWKYGKHSSITIDNVVVQSGYVLLIKRKSHPGKDLWALPGGYLEEDEWTFEGALRELGEETKIDVPPRVLRNSLVFDGWFEAPDRSLINRVVTHAFYFKLPDYKIDGRVTLPKVKGSDDAKKARWFPISEALEMSEVLFDDHFDILEDFLNRPNARDQL